MHLCFWLQIGYKESPKDKKVKAGSKPDKK